jgi:hypothetical protein
MRQEYTIKDSVPSARASHFSMAPSPTKRGPFHSKMFAYPFFPSSLLSLRHPQLIRAALEMILGLVVCGEMA